MGQRRMLARSQRAKKRVQQAALGGLLHNRNSCRGGVATVGAQASPIPLESRQRSSLVPMKWAYTCMALNELVPGNRHFWTFLDYIFY